MHSLHGPHPAPPGLGLAGAQRLLVPRSLRGTEGSGLAAGPGPQPRVGPQHPASIMDPLPKEVSADLLRDTAAGRSCF